MGNIDSAPFNTDNQAGTPEPRAEPYPFVRKVAAIFGVPLIFLLVGLGFWAADHVPSFAGQFWPSETPVPSDTPLPTPVVACGDPAASNWRSDVQVDDRGLCIYPPTPTPAPTPYAFTDEQRAYRDVFYNAFDLLTSCSEALEQTAGAISGGSHRSRTTETTWRSLQASAEWNCNRAFENLSGTYPPPPYDASNPLLDSHARIMLAVVYLDRVIYAVNIYLEDTQRYSVDNRWDDWLVAARDSMAAARNGVDLGRLYDPEWDRVPSPVPFSPLEPTEE